MSGTRANLIIGQTSAVRTLTECMKTSCHKGFPTQCKPPNFFFFCKWAIKKVNKGGRTFRARWKSLMLNKAHKPANVQTSEWAQPEGVAKLENGKMHHFFKKWFHFFKTWRHFSRMSFTKHGAAFTKSAHYDRRWEPISAIFCFSALGPISNFFPICPKIVTKPVQKYSMYAWVGNFVTFGSL